MLMLRRLFDGQDEEVEEQQLPAEAPAQSGRQDDLFGSDSDDDGGQAGPDYDEDAGDEDFQPAAPAVPAATDLKTKLALLAQKKKKEAVRLRLLTSSRPSTLLSCLYGR